MQQDLGLSSGQYSITLIVFFITYVIFEVPLNLILSKSKPSVFLPMIMILWGIVTCCMAAVQTYHQLVALRLVVGILEAGFAPGVLFILSSWYKTNEQSKRFAVYISAAVLSGAFGGLLAGAITGGLEGVHGIRGWRWLFVSLAIVLLLHLSPFSKTDNAARSSRVRQPLAGPPSPPSSCSTSLTTPRGSPHANDDWPWSVSSRITMAAVMTMKINPSLPPSKPLRLPSPTGESGC